MAIRNGDQADNPGGIALDESTGKWHPTNRPNANADQCERQMPGIAIYLRANLRQRENEEPITKPIPKNMTAMAIGEPNALFESTFCILAIEKRPFLLRAL
jgi:hypothetical protein